MLRHDAVWSIAADALMVLKGGDGQILDVNPASERLFLKTRSEICGADIREFFPEEHRALILGHILDSRTSIDSEIVRSDGIRRVVTISSISFEEAGCRHLLLNFQDITQILHVQRESAHFRWALATMLRVTRAALEAKSDIELMQMACDGIVDGVMYNMASVMVPGHDATAKVDIVAFAGPREFFDGLAQTWDDNLSPNGPGCRAVRLGRTQIANDAQDSGLAHGTWLKMAEKFNVRSCVATPLFFAGKTIASLVIYSPRIGAFSDDDVSIFEEWAAGLTLGIQLQRDQANEKQHRQKEIQNKKDLRRSLEQTIATLAAVVEMRDPYTAGHQQRVALLADGIAQRLGLSSDRRDAVHFASLLHDIGKIKIPAEYLSKPGQLSAMEVAMIETHAQASRELLLGIDFPWPLAEIVGQHHERLDGSGYPDGKCGDEISCEARIIAVADVVEAMTSFRPYRHALGIQAALAEIKEQRGRKFDADAVDAACALFDEDGFNF